MDYFDILLAKKLSGGGGGDIEVETLNATENRTYNAGTGKAYNPVVVAVPEPTLIAKSISQNGTYNASDDNADGYSSVTVDVEGYQLKNIANVPTDIASFSDGTDLPMPKLEVGIEAVQSGSGDPSPSNVRPISGWTGANVQRRGKNLINAPDITLSSSGYIFNGSVNLPKGQLTMSWDSTITSLSFAILDADGNTLVSGGHQTPYTFTLPAEAKSARFYSAGAGTFKNIQIEVGSSATDYVPYNPNSATYPITWSEAGTVYGGKLDVTSGVLKLIYGSVNLSDLQWTHNAPNTRSYSIDLDGLIKVSSISEPVNAIAEQLVMVAGSSSLTKNNQMACLTLSNKATLVAFYDGVYEPKGLFVYELATPQTIQLTPTQVKSLLKDNNIWADSGQIISGQYFAEL